MATHTIDKDTGEIVLPLRRKVQDGKKTIAELRVRPNLTVGDMLAMDKGTGPLSQKLHLLAEVTGQPMSVIEKLAPLDWADAEVAVNEMLGKENGQPGEPSSSS